MRKWIVSACALAWLTLALVAAAGLRGPSPAQASGTAASSSNASRTVTFSNASTGTGIRVVLASESATAESTKVTAAAHAPARQAARWTVRPGDTLSQIAAALGIPGGWPALYAANKAAVGPDPGLIRPGTVLALPGRQAPSRYTVAPGDTLSGIAAALGTPGGWPALYAANKSTIGGNANLILPGQVLKLA